MIITPGVCAVPECGVRIKTAFLMCGCHWRAVPLFMKRRVYAAYDQWLKGAIGLDHLRAVQVRAVGSVAAVKGGGSCPL